MNNIVDTSLLKELAFRESTLEFEKKVDEIVSNELEQLEDEKSDLLKILSFLDITTLNDIDYQEALRNIVKETVFNVEDKEVKVAGLCIYSNLLPVLNLLHLDRDVRKVVVSGGFPTGQLSLEAKLHDVAFAMENKADEVDIPINRGLFFENRGELEIEIEAIKSIVNQNPKAKLKVIIESGELKTYKNVYDASLLSINSGADFIKTSTGKVSRGADLYSAAIMMIAIKETLLNTEKNIGFKAAGGIRKSEDALKYYLLAKAILGENYITQDTFRIGCSNLKYDILNKLK